MAWIYLFTAGALEVAWATGLKKLGSGFGWPLAILTGIAMALSIAALYGAMVRLPLGIAYPIWTGIGSVGSVLVGILYFSQSISTTGLIGLALLVLGMALLGADAP